jgi:hydrophobic/amphiphilic exporter-1 (mainly G- bacteria), HAE1 family
MNLSRLSIDRPIFMTCVLIGIVVLGLFSCQRLPVDLFPDVTFPVVTVTTVYPGAGPKEVETSISKPLEEEMGTINGVKNISSTNKEGVSIVVAEFALEIDVKYAEQQVRDKVSFAKVKFPEGTKESIIRRIEPSATPIMMVTLKLKASEGEVFDIATEVVRPKLEQASGVGLVEVLGGRKREIHVEVDRLRLTRAQVGASMVADRLAISGQNIPAGSVTKQSTGSDVVFRTVGEFKTVEEIRRAPVSFFGNDNALTVADLGQVRDALADPTSYGYSNGEPRLVLYVFKQSGFNSVQASANVQKALVKVEEELKLRFPKLEPELKIVTDTSRFVRLNVLDVVESISIGILLTILVVYLFLGNFRSTIITGIAIPVSLVGAFGLMYWAGFSINIMSLLAFSLAVGLLIDDAIVVRENIFRHMEMGKNPRTAALEGTLEVQLAVVAVTLTIIAVFGPIGFLKGVVGQFFKQFGLSVVFIMAISLLDALTNAPMMSAYLGGTHNEKDKPFSMWPPVQSVMDVALWPTRFIFGILFLVFTPVRALARRFDRWQVGLEGFYARMVTAVVRRPWVALVGTLVIVASSSIPLALVPKTFLPPQDSGEFAVGLELPPGSGLEKTRDVALEMEKVLRQNAEVRETVLVVGSRDGDKNKGEFYVTLTPFEARKGRGLTTSMVKDEVRKALEPFKDYRPTVKDIDFVGSGQRPFTIHFSGQDIETVQAFTTKIFERLKDHPGLTDVDTDFRSGKPEFQAQVDLAKAQRLGVTSALVGRELRAQVEGLTPAVYRENGLEYDIRVRMPPEQRDLQKAFSDVLVPNINGRMVRLSDVSQGVTATGPATINRENRGRFAAIMADIRPGGPGVGGVINDIKKWTGPSGDLKLPEGITYRLVGQAENFQELGESMVTAMFLGLIFIFLVLSSLYESFVTPFTIMLVIPLAGVGAFWGLWLGRSSLDLYSMIGMVMLMGLAVKNSIILVDYIEHLRREGVEEVKAVIEACKVRLRPILMTSIALIAGMAPIAYGLNEVSNQRRSLGFAVIGGVITSTLLTLVVIPAIYSYIEWARRHLVQVGTKMFSVNVD